MTAFATIVADPPWPFRDHLPGKARGASKHYTTMTLREIKDYLAWPGRAGRVEMIEIAADARLFLWRVAAMQEEALAVVRAWRFTPKAEMIWIKTRADLVSLHIGMGRTVRNTHEAVLIGQRGHPERLNKSIPSVFRAPYTAHSAKPDHFFTLVEALSPGPYLELFARRQRPGWTCIGDELTDGI